MYTLSEPSLWSMETTHGQQSVPKNCSYWDWCNVFNQCNWKLWALCAGWLLFSITFCIISLTLVNVQQVFLKIRFICCHKTSSQSLAFFFFLAVNIAEMISTVCNALSLHLAHLTWSLCPPTERLQVQHSSLERCFANHNQQMWEAEENCWLFEGVGSHRLHTVESLSLKQCPFLSRSLCLVLQIGMINVWLLRTLHR